MNLKNYILTLIILFGITFHASAQKQPDWTDYYNRNSKYNDNDYLKGFASDALMKDQQPDDLLGKLSSVARSQLIESILVSIKSVAETNIQNINTNSQINFKQTSISVSKANIVGMKYETWYDKKAKTGYAFVYAKKNDVIAYYKNVIVNNKTSIAKKIDNANQLINTNDKQNALKSLFETQPLFLDIEDAQALLLAFGLTDASMLAFDEIKGYDVQVKKMIASLQTNKQLSIGDVAYFIAYGLSLQTNKLDQPVTLGDFTFRTTELNSQFSQQFNKVLEDNLIKTANYTVVNAVSQGKVDESKIQYYLTGTYWDDTSNVRILATMREQKTGKAIASAEGYLPYSYLDANNIAYLPDNFDKIEMLNKLVFKTNKSSFKAKLNKPLNGNLEVIVTTKNSMGIDIPVKNIPVIFYFQKTHLLISQTLTNDSGKATSYIEKLPSLDKMQTVIAELNMPDYLKMDTATSFYKEIKKNKVAPFVKFDISTSTSSVFVQTNEVNLGQKLNVTIIEPKLKDALSANGFAFVKEKEKADLFISIEAQTRQGNSYSGIFFSYLDASVSITDASTGDEVYKNAYSDIKGGAADFNQAGMKAFIGSTSKICDDIIKQLKK